MTADSAPAPAAPGKAGPPELTGSGQILASLEKAG